MKEPNTTPLNTLPLNKDLIEQAHPGHGVPSQDPESPAQFTLNPVEADREANSVLTGGGMVAGAATGAAIGAVAAGPVGVFVGGTVGALVGALGAAAAGAVVDPEAPKSAATAIANTPPVQLEGHAAGGQPAEPAATHTTQTSPGEGLNRETLDTLGKDFGAFYPRGHTVVAFQARAHLEQLTKGLQDIGRGSTEHLEVTSQRMIEFAERNIHEALFIATLGTSVDTLRGFLAAAKNDAVFLVVATPDDETAEQVTAVLRVVPHLLAERYRDLAIETIA